MKNLLNTLQQFLLSLAADDDGSQVIEYALIIAVVSIALVVGLRALVTGTSFTGFISRVATCLGGTSCT
jgi:pilus assembly protein Flp/PilA